MDEILYRKTITCPVCGNEFKQTKPRQSMLHLIKRDTDMCSYYEGVNPYYYEINVCPKCGFSFLDRFKKDISNADKANFLKTVTMHWKKQDFRGKRDLNQAIETYKMAILSGRTIDLNASAMAGICMRLCWLYRGSGNIEEEKRFMKVAADFYEKAYEIGGAYGEDAVKPEIIVYLLGELSFRLGNNKDATKWFSLAISKYACDPNVKRKTADMIRDRWLDIKDQVKGE